MDRRRGGDADEDEVNSLLRAAEDELLLKLSVNSHMSRGASQAAASIDPKLDRRFQALKSSRRPTNKTPLIPQPPRSSDKPKDEKRVADRDIDNSSSEDDLLARFAVLKSSTPRSSASSSDAHDPRCQNKSKFGEERLNQGTIGSDSVDEDEVQKLIQWAIDAARLDPSPPTDSDDGDKSGDDEDDDDSDEEAEDHQKIQKGNMKKGQKRK